MSEYTEPGRYCSWDPKSKLVGQAKKLAQAATKDSIRAVYQWCIDKVDYDQDKADQLEGKRGYVPDPEATFESGSGVCFDEASLMCAMLRSLGIPTKLVIGTIDGVSHAWVSAYDGKKWLKCDPTLQGWQKDREYVTKYEL